jgi:hypothetical protein
MHVAAMTSVSFVHVTMTELASMGQAAGNH